MNRLRDWYNRNPGFFEILMGIIRFWVALAMVLAIIGLGGFLYENVDAHGLAHEFQKTSTLFRLIPTEVIAFFIYVFSWVNLRFALPVVGALTSVLIAGAYYVKDIYNLKQISDAARYVLSSMFAIRYPRIQIDRGQKEMPRKETNLIEAIGGPGYALIQPGNGVFFRNLLRNSRFGNIVTQSVRMPRFETIGAITNLDDQDGYVEETLPVFSRDGIKIKVRDVRYRYRILPQIENGRPVARTAQNPYPFSEPAFTDLYYSLSIAANGPTLWGYSINFIVTGAIENYISSRTVDVLTAPRSSSYDPRQEIRNQLFGPDITGRLRNAGTQLLWVDIGQFDIEVDEVDRERINLWAADWEGDADIQRAKSEALRTSLQEQGRAEGQAEILREITRALSGIDTTGKRAKSVRLMILMRIAQTLDAMRDNHLEDSSSSNKPIF